MGVDIGYLIDKKEIELKELSGSIIAFDAHNMLYQFLSIIRQRDGTPLMNSRGEVTSHLSGLFYRTINLIENGIKPIFVFDGKPPDFKENTLMERKKIKTQAKELWEEAKKLGKEEEAFKYAQATSRIDENIVKDSKILLKAIGIPCVQAPSEGEAQASFMAIREDADYVASQDYDSLLFGAPVVVRNLAITGKRKVPRKNIYMVIKPEVIELKKVLNNLGSTREQLIDIALLIGTDYNKGLKNIGPKSALKLIKKYKSIEKVLNKLKKDIDFVQEIKEFFLNPEVTTDYKLQWKTPNKSEIKEFLCDTHDFSEARVNNALDRINKKTQKTQKTLDKWSN